MPILSRRFRAASAASVRCPQRILLPREAILR